MDYKLFNLIVIQKIYFFFNSHLIKLNLNYFKRKKNGKNDFTASKNNVFRNIL